MFSVNRTRMGSAASISPSTSSKARGMRRQQRKNGRIRAGRYLLFLCFDVVVFVALFLGSFLLSVAVNNYPKIFMFNLSASPGEEMALVDHLKGMSLAVGARCELKSLLSSLVLLGNEDIARKLQRVGENFQLSQVAAVRLAEDAMASDVLDEHAYSLERYILKVRKELLQSADFSWQSKIFLPP